MNEKKQALVIIAREGFQDVELAGTIKGLGASKMTVTLASTEAGSCKGKFGSIETASVALKDVAVSRFGLVVFIGGPGAGSLAYNPEAIRIARDAVKAGVLLGAICIAPTILAFAGVLDGKQATVWDSGGEQARLLTKHGAIYTGEAVTVHDKIVTANGPAAAEEFGRKLRDMA